MRFIKLKLFTNQLEAELLFYTQTIGFELLSRSDNSFTVKIGWTALTFERARQDYIYHYCFLIPSNQLQAALSWLQEKTELIKAPDGTIIQHFEDWNADSFYFYDASGNIAECIVRYDLENQTAEDFDITQFLCVNEMGMPTNDISTTNKLLEQGMKSSHWKGNFSRFSTHGSLEGMILLPNYEVKETWFPTSKKIKPQPFSAVIESTEKLYTCLLYTSDAADE